jgi:hypothetical protein
VKYTGRSKKPGLRRESELTNDVLMCTDEKREKKESDEDKSQPGDGKEHQGRKGEGETLSVCADIKDFSAMRPLSTLSIVSGATYHVYCFSLPNKGECKSCAVGGECRAYKGQV